MSGTETSGKWIEIEQPPIVETAVLGRLVLPSDSDREVQESLDEMKRLAWTAGANVACVFMQRRVRPCPATLIGAGKAAEMKAAVDETGADVVLFDSNLSPGQAVNLENILGVKVVDRTQLILDIFAQRAQTNEGKHQVELAQLQYMLPRLVGRGSVMRQQGGIGVRGPGEQKLEVDRRVIRRRIQRLEEDIENIRKSRREQRRRRAEGTIGTVALVGYTNAGKSSLLNALAGADVFVENKLFATLDPRARRCVLPSQREAVLTDTVGFIRRLPHSLVAAFRATLEEVAEADLLLLVADASDPAVGEQIQAVYDVLAEIHAIDKPRIVVFNKTDIADRDQLRPLLWGSGTRMAVSARTGEGLPELLAEVDKHLAAGFRCVRLSIPHHEAGILARIRRAGRILKQEYAGDAVLVEAEIDPAIEWIVAAYRVAEAG